MNWCVALRRGGCDFAQIEGVHQKRPDVLRLFLCGDVMTGRGIDQILPASCPPSLHEPYVKNARAYVRMAEQRNGPIPREVAPDYIWGDALAEFQKFAPALRLINLETSITLSEQWEDKGINYRMHPANIDCLRAAGIDFCALANNHILDWGGTGMRDTIRTLQVAGIRAAGAGDSLDEARSPAVFNLPGQGRVLVYSLGMSSSGIPPHWFAQSGRGGVFGFGRPDRQAVSAIADQVSKDRQAGDLVIASVHWGGNWGYEIAGQEVDFARALIESAGIDLFHGHSSHHPKAYDIHQGRLILYGCGDFINDYEGIFGNEGPEGHDRYRPDLSLMYFIDYDQGRVQRFSAVPTQLRKFQVKRAYRDDANWLVNTLNGECGRFGTGFDVVEGELGLILRGRV